MGEVADYSEIEDYLASRWKGCHMQHVSEPPAERFVTTSSPGIVLECPCGEKLFFLGREAGWRKEGRTTFACGVCGEELSLDDVSRRREEATSAQLFIPSILSTFRER